MSNNLKPAWKKGESGNPKGRPKGSLNRSTIVKKWLEANQKTKNPITSEDELLSQEDIITLAILKKARNGDVQAYKALMDSCYGTAKDTLDLNQEGNSVDFNTLLGLIKKK